MAEFPANLRDKVQALVLNPPTICGGMPEWTNGAVLKTAVPLRVPEVRILLPPQIVGGEPCTLRKKNWPKSGPVFTFYFLFLAFGQNIV